MHIILTYKECKLISSVAVQGCEIDTVDFRTQVRGQLYNACCVIQECPRIGMAKSSCTRVNMIEGRQRRIMLVSWEDRKKVGISVRFILGGLLSFLSIVLRACAKR